VIGDIIGHVPNSLLKCNSLLNKGMSTNNGGISGGNLPLALALHELCTNRRAATALAGLPLFLLPPANAPATNKHAKTASWHQLAMMCIIQSMRGEMFRLAGGYLCQLGPTLERDTILGLVLHLGLSTNGSNPALPSVMLVFLGAATQLRKDVFADHG
jgi:hypothetical protein